MKTFLSASLSLVIAGCTVGPEYRSPSLPSASTFAEGEAKALGEVARRQWWRQFNDPMLTDLVSRGLNQSLDIAAANERIEGARAALRQTGVSAAVDGGASANSTYRRNGQTVSLLTRSTNSYARARELSQANFEAGSLSLLDLLDTDRSLAGARLGLAAAVRDQAVNWATLQVALGAGAYP